MDQSDCKVAWTPMDEWKFALMAPGVQCVVMNGMILMLMLHADS